MAEMKIPGWLRVERETGRDNGASLKGERFIDKTLDNIASFMKEAFDNAESSYRGILQSVEPRARIIGIFFLVFAAAFAGKVLMLSAVISLTIVLALLSGVGIGRLLKRVLPVLVFTSIIVAPIFLSFFTAGSAIFKVRGVGVTKEGLETGCFIIARVVAMSGLASLLLLTTKQADLFRGLRGIVPAFFAGALFMTFRYVFILLKTAEDAALARKSRTITGTDLRGSQGWFATRAGFILKKTVSTADEVTLAMVSRGFAGKVRTFESPGLRGKDFVFIGFSSFVLFLSIGL